MNHLHMEVYGHGEPLIMVHGWAMHSGLWRNFAERLSDHYQVICVDLPGHGMSPKLDNFALNSICQLLADQLPESSHWLGWSLGGLISIEMSRLFPDHVNSITLLASNPKFVKAQDWPGIMDTVLQQFAASLVNDCRKTLLRFLSLQIRGQESFKQLSQELKQAIQSSSIPDTDTLISGLNILSQTDFREILMHLDKPILVVLGAKDTLVPVEAGKFMHALNPNIRMKIIDEAGHVPFLSHTNELMETIVDFLSEQ